MKIYIDADGCPVVRNTLKIAENSIFHALSSATLHIALSMRRCGQRVLPARKPDSKRREIERYAKTDRGAG